MAWLRLLRSRRVGPATFHRLMGEHGSAEAALAALPGVARAAGVEDYRPCPPGVAEAELAAGRAAGARLLLHGRPGYPAALLDLPDAPPALWALGDPGLLARPALALVGARNASSLGLRMARALARDLGAAGQVIVSGLARGVDAAAHEAALEHGTIAVMAGGVDVLYPSENAALARRIDDAGLRLSEQPMGAVPRARHFPARNRIIAGLARAVVVVEAAARSGSLITARTALDQGRDVLAVPGHPFDARAAGCNALIRDGAPLVRGAEDVLETLAPTAEPGLPLGTSDGAAGPHPGSRPSDGPSAPGGRGAARNTASGTAARETAPPGAPTTPPQDRGRAPAPSPPRAPVRGGAQAGDASRRDPEQERGARAEGDPQREPGEAPGDRRPGEAAPQTAALHAQILARLGPSPLAEDQLIRDLGAGAEAVAPALLDLELDGRITRQPGGLLALA
ncbi:DNA-processing protein DprA [Rhodosalinus sediminis]|uniref:DNA-processing protein DprA n=1 Tax=Rhodosalinus sediminis TaxID=1940533 RepID=UPI0023573063|nr:DNA-processing protein DprA [Rhodosalinus sediminis]